jgi:RNA-directed DNA polymerase
VTKPRYPQGCADESKACGTTVPSDYAWYVNLHTGNVNRNNQTNHNRVRAVRASESQSTVSFRALHNAWRRARRGKKPSPDQLTFDSYWIDNLFDLQHRIIAGTWSPGIPTCFIATAPKAREIHAPPFADRVVHHWLVPQLEAIYEPTFIHDSYSNRMGKGTHAAVERLRNFVREVYSGQGGGWFLQLDVANFFNTINRKILYRFLKKRMEQHGIPAQLQRATHALLRQSPIDQGVNFVGTAIDRSRVPAHKKLENSPPGCGLAIGNLSSQFFANVYLDRLDQYVKHDLNALRYLRYVDDFVLVHRDRGQLEVWQRYIEHFLATELQLKLKSDIRLKPLTSGIDFLGYVVYPTHTVVRRRVIGHCRQKLHAWRQQHPQPDQRALEQLRSVVASYRGHFSHANSWKARQRIGRRFPWLRDTLKESA